MISFVKFFRIRKLYSLYFCFRYLPFYQAIHMPIVFYKRAKIIMYKNAKIVINDTTIGRVYLGDYQMNFAHGKEYTTINNKGIVYFYKGGIRIQSGGIWYVVGQVHIHGNGVLFGNNTRLNCFNRIEIGSKTQITHECQIMDTNFHFIRDLNTGNIPPVSSPVIIGKCCWIGNRTTINKGTIIPDYTIVGSNSLLNKDYTKSIPSNCLIAGQPAKLIKQNLERVSFVNSILEEKLHLKEFSNINPEIYKHEKNSRESK